MPDENESTQAKGSYKVPASGVVIEQGGATIVGSGAHKVVPPATIGTDDPSGVVLPHHNAALQDKFAASVGAHGGIATEEVNIETEALRSVATRAESLAASIEECVKDMQGQVSASDAIWVGKAADWYRDVFVTSSGRFGRTLEECMTYTREMRAYANEYEGVAYETEQIAENVEKPSS